MKYKQKIYSHKRNNEKKKMKPIIKSLFHNKCVKMIGRRFLSNFGSSKCVFYSIVIFGLLKYKKTVIID